jgi:hypothetical protein
MSHQEPDLDVKALFLLGLLAEAPNGTSFRADKLPRGCDVGEALTLLRAGYVAAFRPPASDAAQEAEYKITQKGLDAWRDHQFAIPETEPEPERK